MAFRRARASAAQRGPSPAVAVTPQALLALPRSAPFASAGRSAYRAQSRRAACGASRDATNDVRVSCNGEKIAFDCRLANALRCHPRAHKPVRGDLTRHRNIAAQVQSKSADIAGIAFVEVLDFRHFQLPHRLRSQTRCAFYATRAVLLLLAARIAPCDGEIGGSCAKRRRVKTGTGSSPYGSKKVRADCGIAHRCYELVDNLLYAGRLEEASRVLQETDANGFRGQSFSLTPRISPNGVFS